MRNIKIIDHISPGWALKREVQKQQLRAIRRINNYTGGGASTSKKSIRSWLPRPKESQKDLNENVKQLLMGRSADLYMNSTIGSAIVKKIITNVVGPGLRLKSTIDARALGMTQDQKKELEKQIETLWELWSENELCDFTRSSNFYELQTLMMYSWLIYGEGIALLPMKKRAGDYFNLKVQLIDPLRLKNPTGASKDNVKNGIELDKDGVFKAIYIENRDLITQKTEIKRVEAFGKKSGRKNVLILTEKERIGQRVGTPLLTPVIEEIKQLGDWQKSELTAAVTSSIFTFFIKNKHPESIGITGRDETIINEKGDKVDIKEVDVEPGSFFELGEGQDIEAPPTGRPVIAFDAFLMTLTKTIGAAIGLPAEVLLNAFNSNYSASRAALLEVWKMYTTKRTRLKEKFCNPVFYEFMDEVVAQGFINIPGYFKNPLIRKAVVSNEWYGPVQGNLDPFREAKADELDIANNLKTRSKITQERFGTSFEKTIDQIGVEQKMIKEAIEKEVKEE